MMAESGNRLELLIAVETKCKIAGGMFFNATGHVSQSGQIPVNVAIDFDFKMPQPVRFNALAKYLREGVVDPIV